MLKRISENTELIRTIAKGKLRFLGGVVGPDGMVEGGLKEVRQSSTWIELRDKYLPRSGSDDRRFMITDSLSGTVLKCTVHAEASLICEYYHALKIHGIFMLIICRVVDICI